MKRDPLHGKHAAPCFWHAGKSPRGLMVIQQKQPLATLGGHQACRGNAYVIRGGEQAEWGRDWGGWAELLGPKGFS